MKRNLYVTVISVMAFLFTLSCGEETPDSPNAVTLLSPANNSACLKGSSESGTTAMVAFSWNKATNADSYVLEIKNLQTEQTTNYITVALTHSATLSVGTHYSWSVTSVNSVGKTAGEAWKFYLSGVAASNYAPFPAELIAPVSGSTINTNGSQTVKVTLQWIGSDVDNDIESYAIYLDNTNASTQIVASQTKSSCEQTLQSGKTYYWKVVTTDKAGNKSTSIVSLFQIKVST